MFTSRAFGQDDTLFPEAFNPSGSITEENEVIKINSRTLPRVSFNLTEVETFLQTMALEETTRVSVSEILIEINKNYADISTSLNNMQGDYAPKDDFIRVIIDCCNRTEAFAWRIQEILSIINRKLAVKLYQILSEKTQNLKGEINFQALHGISALKKSLEATKRLLASQGVFCAGDHQRALKEHLLDIRQLFNHALLSQRNANPSGPTLFISYAWPLEEYLEAEQYLQAFLSLLRDHLRFAGIRVSLDIIDCAIGTDIYAFMRQIKNSDACIIVLTRSYRDKEQDEKLRAMQYEMNLIREKHNLDKTFSTASKIFPVLFSGNLALSSVPDIKMYSNIEDWCERSYLENLKKLLWLIYNNTARAELGSGKIEEYEKLWQKFQVENHSSALDDGIVDTEFLFQHHQKIMEKIKYTKTYDDLYKHQKSMSISDLSISQKNDDLFVQMKDHLKRFYLEQDKVELHSPTDQPLLLPIDEIYVEGLIVKNQDADENTWSKTSGNDSESTETILDFEMLFKGENNPTFSHRIFLLGHGGTGKSLFCKSEVIKWSRPDQELNQKKFDWVFLFNLRTLVSAFSNESSIAEIFYDIFFKNFTINNVITLLNSLSKNPEKILFIFDGFDEIPSPSKNKCWSDVIENVSKKTKFSILITSRPYMSLGDRSKYKSFEILGFSDNAIQDYVTKYYERTKSSSRLASSGFLEAKQLWRDTLRLPINLEYFLASFFSHGDETGSEAKKIITQSDILYKIIFKILISFYEEKSGSENDNERTLREKQAKVRSRQALLSLGSAVSEVIKNDGSFLLEELAEKFYSTTKNITDPNSLLLYLIRIGLFQVSDGNKERSEKRYYFRHSIFGEYFSATHFANQIITQEDSARIFLKRNKFDPQYQQMLVYTAGILSENTKNLEKYFSFLLEKPRDIVGGYEMELLAYCCDEAKWPDIQIINQQRDRLIAWSRNFFQKIKSKNLSKQYNFISKILTRLSNSYLGKNNKKIALLNDVSLCKKNSSIGYFLVSVSLVFLLYNNYFQFLTNVLRFLGIFIIFFFMYCKIKNDNAEFSIRNPSHYERFLLYSVVLNVKEDADFILDKIQVMNFYGKVNLLLSLKYIVFLGQSKKYIAEYLIGNILNDGNLDIVCLSLHVFSNSCLNFYYGNAISAHIGLILYHAVFDESFPYSDLRCKYLKFGVPLTEILSLLKIILDEIGSLKENLSCLQKTEKCHFFFELYQYFLPKSNISNNFKDVLNNMLFFILLVTTENVNERFVRVLRPDMYQGLKDNISSAIPLYINFFGRNIEPMQSNIKLILSSLKTEDTDTSRRNEKELVDLFLAFHKLYAFNPTMVVHNMKNLFLISQKSKLIYLPEKNIIDEILEKIKPRFLTEVMPFHGIIKFLFSNVDSDNKAIESSVDPVFLEKNDFNKNFECYSNEFFFWTMSSSQKVAFQERVQNFFGEMKTALWQDDEGQFKYYSVNKTLKTFFSKNADDLKKAIAKELNFSST